MLLRPLLLLLRLPEVDECDDRGVDDDCYAGDVDCHDSYKYLDSFDPR